MNQSETINAPDISFSLQPGTVRIEQDLGRTQAAYPYTLVLRRSDGSIRDLAQFQELTTATRARDRVREAVQADEEWIRTLIEVSSGEHRA